MQDPDTGEHFNANLSKELVSDVTEQSTAEKEILEKRKSTASDFHLNLQQQNSDITKQPSVTTRKPPKSLVIALNRQPSSLIVESDQLVARKEFEQLSPLDQDRFSILFDTRITVANARHKTYIESLNQQPSSIVIDSDELTARNEFRKLGEEDQIKFIVTKKRKNDPGIAKVHVSKTTTNGLDQPTKKPKSKLQIIALIKKLFKSATKNSSKLSATKVITEQSAKNLTSDTPITKLIEKFSQPVIATTKSLKEPKKLKIHPQIMTFIENFSKPAAPATGSTYETDLNSELKKFKETYSLKTKTEDQRSLSDIVVKAKQKIPISIPAPTKKQSLSRCL